MKWGDERERERKMIIKGSEWKWECEWVRESKMRMNRWRNWSCFGNSLLFQTKSLLRNFTSCLRYKAKGNLRAYYTRTLHKKQESFSFMFGLSIGFKQFLFWFGVTCTEGNMNGLMMLYKDMESCEECGDIRVMWEMIQSTRPPTSIHNTRRRRSWRFCFRPKETDCKS